MKIRDELNRKKRNVFLLIIIAFVLATLADTLIVKLKFEYSMVFGFVIFGFAIIYSYGIKCPSCEERMGQFLIQVGTPFSIPKKFKHCPFCGVNIDTEIDKINL